MELKNYSNECLYKDTYTIISMMNDDLKNKINKKFIEFLEKNQDKNFEGTINSKIPLKQQELRYEVRLMLSLIYMYYICDDETRKEILQQENKNINEFYNKNIFEKNIFDEDTVESQNEEIQENAMVEYKESFLDKIIRKLKGLLKRSKE